MMISAALDRYEEHKTETAQTLSIKPVTKTTTAGSSWARNRTQLRVAESRKAANA